uniref:5'-3' exonuclease domain-containing protein n=1 Tax=Kalanchoe fedtschenkoi TaxID=63787 RepID=A0A7N0VG71_KALFE
MIRLGRAAVCPCLAPTPYGPLSCAGVPNNKVNATTRNAKARGITAAASAPSPAFDRMPGGRVVLEEPGDIKRWNKKKRVFFLDVNPLCYAGSKPSLRSFAHWISLFFSQVSHDDPVIAVLDGERGNEHRRKLLPSYKAHRRGVSRRVYTPRSSQMVPVEKSHEAIINVLQRCNVPVLKLEDHEADDVVATLVEQVLQQGYKVVIASPDKDFKQLVSEDVQIVMPLPELKRWSFYTLKHYQAQYSCDPGCDLSLRCIMGDEADGIPGIQHLAPGFGKKTALKLLKKHGSLENLLNAAAVKGMVFAISRPDFS